MTLVDPVQVALLVTHILENLQVQYIVVGSLASSLHGTPRATQDIDIATNFKHYHIASFVKATQSSFYVDEDVVREAVQFHASFNIIHLQTMFKIDIFVKSEDHLAQEEMGRGIRFQLPDHPSENLLLASPEDTVLHKPRWFNLGGQISERQWKDTMSVLQVCRNQLDYAYLSRMASALGVSELLEKALNELGI